ncbi:hypothetical protein CC79DRAFT_1377821 [Sarocladium strictum]
MRFSALSLAAISLASLAEGLDVSENQDANVSVWENVDTSILARGSDLWNRPVKRQSGWNPPSNLKTPLKEVWDHQLATYSGGLYGFRNYGWDQLIATQGSINICVRWESNTAVTEAQRSQIATVANQQYQKWFQWLYGFDNFPYSNIKVNVVGWAVRDKNLLQGSTSGIDVYTNTDSEGAPQCAPECGRFFNQNGDYSKCPGGAARHYDQSLWLTDGFGGGAGGDWGQRIGREYFMSNLGSSDVHILLHEMGHTFGLDDFYDWTPTGANGFLMKAGSASVITDFDGWMLRNWWYELSRNRGWQSASSTSPSLNQSSSSNSNPNPSSTSNPNPSPAAPAFGQCGGSGWTGPTTCAAGYKCTVSNEWYSQCLAV